MNNTAERAAYILTRCYLLPNHLSAGAERERLGLGGRKEKIEGDDDRQIICVGSSKQQNHCDANAGVPQKLDLAGTSRRVRENRRRMTLGGIERTTRLGQSSAMQSDAEQKAEMFAGARTKRRNDSSERTIEGES